MAKIKFVDSVKKEIVSTITNKNKVKYIILFGSYASGTPTNESDLDPVVVLEETGFPKSYLERINRSLTFSKLLADIKTKFPIDLFVYSSDEWKKLISINGSFIRQIIEHGIRLL